MTHNTKLSLNSHRNTWNDQKREDKKIRKKKPTKSLTWNFKSTWNHIASILQHFFEQPIMKPSSHFTEIKVRLQAALTARENASCKKKKMFHLISINIFIGYMKYDFIVFCCWIKCDIQSFCKQVLGQNSVNSITWAQSVKISHRQETQKATSVPSVRSAQVS